jgi:hypothetical protein
MTRGCTCPPFVATCPGVPDRWAEIDNLPPTSHWTPFNIDGHCSSGIIGSSVTLEAFASHLQADAPAPGMSGHVEDQVNLSGTWDPNAFTYSFQIDAAVQTDPVDPVPDGGPGPFGSLHWSEKIIATFSTPWLIFGDPFTAGQPYASFQLIYRLTKQAFEIVDGGAWHYSLDIGVVVQHRLVVGGPVTTEASSSSTIAEASFIAGRVAFDRNLARGSLRVYDPFLGWQDFPITHDLSGLSGPYMRAKLDFFRTTEWLTAVVDKNTSTADMSITDLVPCVDIPTRGSTDGLPVRNQPVQDEIVGLGDGVTTIFATNFAYVGTSLHVEVSGILSEADPTDPTTGAFTLIDPAPPGAIVTASYQASGL